MTPDGSAWTSASATWPPSTASGCAAGDGTFQDAYDYCLSLKAPAEDFRYAADFLAAAARKSHRPPRPLWAHIETRFSQESNTQPEIPCMQRWAERFEAVNHFRPPLEGLIANWYHQGFYPTPVTELFGWMSYTRRAADGGTVAGDCPPRFWPRPGRVACCSAWHDFSEAIWHFPFYYGLSATMNAGLAQPFWLDAKAANPRPWRRGFVNSLKEMATLRRGRRSRQRAGKPRPAGSGAKPLACRVAEASPAAAASARAFTRRGPRASCRTAQSFSDKVDVTLRLVGWLDARHRLAESRTRRRAALGASTNWSASAGQNWPPRGPRCRCIVATAAWAT